LQEEIGFQQVAQFSHVSFRDDIPETRTTGDNLQIGEAGQGNKDVLRKTLAQYLIR
jgi:hypothetical protein